MDATGAGIVALAFVAGAIPWGFLIGKLIAGVDLRTIGSGGTGATNVLRTLGARASAAVFALDLLKGLFPVLLARSLGLAPWWIAAAAVATVVGHCWSPFIGFSGGKGVATGAGAAVGLFPPVLLALPVAAALVWATRFVSLGSLAAVGIASAIALMAAAVGLLAWPSAAAILVMTGIIIVRHEGNIRRLANGTERRLDERVSL